RVVFMGFDRPRSCATATPPFVGNLIPIGVLVCRWSYDLGLFDLDGPVRPSSSRARRGGKAGGSFFSSLARRKFKARKRMCCGGPTRGRTRIAEPIYLELVVFRGKVAPCPGRSETPCR